MRRKVNHYPDEFKLKVLQEYFESDNSIKEIKLKYGIRGNSTIFNWIRKFGMKSSTEEQIRVTSIQ